MQTIRLFDKNPYQTVFDARILRVKDVDGKYGLIFNETFFFPTSGGQPGDTGHLDEIPVLDVFEEDKKIIHVVEKEIKTGSQVHGQVNWLRRFDHMQQHTGQHILSQCFYRHLNAETVGFHLGHLISTIDLNMSNISENQFWVIESKVNVVVFENRDVIVKQQKRENTDHLPLRKVPAGGGFVRVVEINGFDYTACCGTHVRRTGEVGLVKVIDWERYKGGMRVAFVCGHRALMDYHKKSILFKKVGQVLSASKDDIPDVLNLWQEEKKSSAKRIKELLNKTLAFEAIQLESQGIWVGDFKIIVHIFENRARDEIQLLAQKIARRSKLIALLGLKNGSGHVFIVSSPEVNLDVRPLIHIACDRLGGRGGGSATFAQCSCMRPDQLPSALEDIKTHIIQEIQ